MTLGPNEPSFFTRITPLESYGPHLDLRDFLLPLLVDEIIYPQDDLVFIYRFFHNDSISTSLCVEAL